MMDPEQNWARQVRAALLERRAQVNGAPAADRSRYYRQVVESELDKVQLRDRPVYLRALEEEFPAWMASGSPIPPPMPPAPPAEPPPLSNEELIRELISRSKQMSEEERKACAKRLKEAGIEDGSAASGSVSLSSEFCAKYGLPPGAKVDYSKVLELLTLTARHLEEVFDTGATVWRRIDPATGGVWDPPGDFRSRVGPAWLQGSLASTTQELLKKRSLILALLMAGHSGGSQFWAQVGFLFAPHTIEAAVGSERRYGAPDSERFKAACWNKFKEKCKEYPPAVIVQLFHLSVVKAVKVNSSVYGLFDAG